VARKPELRRSTRTVAFNPSSKPCLRFDCREWLACGDGRDSAAEYSVLGLQTMWLIVSKSPTAQTVTLFTTRSLSRLTPVSTGYRDKPGSISRKQLTGILIRIYIGYRDLHRSVGNGVYIPHSGTPPSWHPKRLHPHHPESVSNGSIRKRFGCLSLRRLKRQSEADRHARTAFSD